MRIRTARRITQIVFLGVFVGLFYAARRVAQGDVSLSATFLRADPLAAFTAALAGARSALWWMIPSLVLLGLTVLLGRFFCGWVCPLGTCVDLGDRVLRRRRRTFRYEPRRAWKYYLLGGLLGAALLGAQFSWWLDPLPLLSRTLAVVCYPLALWARDFPALHAAGLLDRLGLHPTPLAHPGYGLGLPVALMFLGLLGLGAVAPRFWCRSLCPLGALLGVVGRWAPLRRRVGEACISCGRCERNCKMGAIPEDAPERTLTAECILCWNCMACPTHTTAIGLRGGREQADETLDTRKRAFLGALGLGVLGGLIASTGLARNPRSNRLIRPPGANRRSASGKLSRMEEGEFRGRCLRCGACMRACPTGGLQPVVAEAGFEGVFSPVLIPTVGWCEHECSACGQVCPSGALQPFRVAEKPDIKLGLATVNRNKCLSWRTGSEYKRCLVCNEVCPYNAAQAWHVQGEDRPVVVAANCTGCGLCENKCPIKPGAAIEVFRAES
jgi:polyferredoxin